MAKGEDNPIKYAVINAANGGISVTPTDVGCFETATENTLLNIAATGDVDGHLTYQEFTEITT